MYRCFHWRVWAAITLVIICCGSLWFLLRRSHIKSMYDRKKHETNSFLSLIQFPFNFKRRLSKHAVEKEKHKPKNLFQSVFYDTLIMMMSGSVVHLPSRWIERIFVTLCMLFGLVVVGLFQVTFFVISSKKFGNAIFYQHWFQGILTGFYSAEPYYKDIDTLEELDEIGLPIGTTSGSLGNIFKLHYGSTVIQSLASKFTVSNYSVVPSTIERTAWARDICSVERLNDVKVIIAVKYKKLLNNF